MRTCPRCGAELPDDARFCPFDRTPMPEGPEATEAAEQRAGSGVSRDQQATGQWKAPSPGDVLLGRYRVLRHRGARGPGRYVEAEDLEDEHKVLLQVFPRPRGAEGADRRAAMRERAEALCNLRDPGAVPVVRAGEETDKKLILVSQHAAGFSAAEMLRHVGPLPAARIVRIGAELAGTLHAAHKQDLVHGNLAPEFVFLTREGDDERTLLGGWRVPDEPDPKAVVVPEEQAGGELDARSDVYLLGAVLYQMLTGTFGVEPPSKAAPDLDIPWDLESVIVRCIHVDRHRRPASASEVRQLLVDCRCYGSWTKTQVAKSWAAMPISDLADQFRPEAAARQAGRARTLAWGSVAVLVAIVAIAFLGLRRPPPDGEAPEERRIVLPSRALPQDTGPEPAAEAGPPPDAADTALPPATPEATPAAAHKRPRAPAAHPGHAAPAGTAAHEAPAPLPPFPALPPAEAELPSGHPGRKFLLRGRALFRAGKFGKAIKQLKAARKHAKLPVLLREIAATYAALNDHGKAIRWYRRYAAEGQLNQLEKQTLERLIKHLRARQRGDAGGGGDVPAPAGPSAKDPRALYRAGALAYDAGDLRVALTRFRDAYTIQPAVALEYNIGLCLERLGKTDEAVHWYERFVRRPQVERKAGKDLRIRIERLRQGKSTAGVASRIR